MAKKQTAKEALSNRKAAPKRILLRQIRNSAGGGTILETMAHLANPSVDDVASAVRIAMTRIKTTVKPSEIRLNDTLKKWAFSRIDARGLAPKLTAYYYYDEILILEPRLQNYETEDVTLTVRQIAKWIRDNHRFIGR